MLVNISHAEYLPSPRKRAILETVSLHLESAKILVRLIHDLGLLSEELYLKMESGLQEIGKMLGGWIKSLH